MCTPAPENAIPATVEASAIAVRASRSSPSATAVRRLLADEGDRALAERIREGVRTLVGRALREAAGARGCRRRTPCRPRARASARRCRSPPSRPAGTRRSTPGRRSRASGGDSGARPPSSCRGGESRSIATVVTSEPVPEVVGSATSGRTGPGTGRAATDRGVDVVEQLAGVRREERAQLRGVERGAAADPDEAVVPLPRPPRRPPATESRSARPRCRRRCPARRRPSPAPPGSARRAPTGHEARRTRRAPA